MRIARALRLAAAALAAVCVFAPLAAFAFYKPSRVIAPSLGPVTCVSAEICIDDTGSIGQARRLYAEGLAIVEASLGAPERKPRAIFCTTRDCAKYFGDDVPAAFNVGTVGFVINPRGMTSYFVAHEMIHHVQNERLGSLSAWSKPVWWREGMAYSLSGDPRRPIPGDGTLERYRVRFERWSEGMDRSTVWAQSEAL